MQTKVSTSTCWRSRMLREERYLEKAVCKGGVLSHRQREGPCAILYSFALTNTFS